jgi:hypothetical protein
MRYVITPKVVLLSTLYVIVAAILLLLVDVGLFYLFNGVIKNVFNWFNSLNFFFKIFLLLFGGYAVFMGFMNLTSRVTSLLGGIIFNQLPVNFFTMFVPAVLAIGNLVMCLIYLWRTPSSYNFWVVCELLILSVFVWSLCAIVVPAREQAKEFQRSN